MVGVTLICMAASQQCVGYRTIRTTDQVELKGNYLFYPLTRRKIVGRRLFGPPHVGRRPQSSSKTAHRLHLSCSPLQPPTRFLAYTAGTACEHRQMARPCPAPCANRQPPAVFAQLAEPALLSCSDCRYRVSVKTERRQQTRSGQTACTDLPRSRSLQPTKWCIHHSGPRRLPRPSSQREGRATPGLFRTS